MADDPTVRPAPPKAKPKGKSYGGLTRNQWLIAGGVFAASLGLILWRRHQAAKAAAANPAAATGANGECTDGSGNIINCADSATAQELSALQNELDTLGAGGSGGGGGFYQQGSDTGASSTTDGTTGITGTGNATGATTTTTAAGGPITVTPVGLHTTQVSATSVGVAWTAPTIPAGQGPLTGYTAEVYNANGTSEGTPWRVPPSQLYANAGGLKSKTAYHINVWCDPAKTGGPNSSVSFTTK